MARSKYKKGGSRRRDYDYEPVPTLSPETKRGIFIVLLFVAALLIVFSLFNLAGAVGSYINQGVGSIFGWGIYLIPLIFIFLAYFLLRPEKYEVKPSNYLGLMIFIFSYLGILQIIKGFNQEQNLITSGGGYLGRLAAVPLHNWMGSLASFIILLAFLIISLLITFNTGLNAMLGKFNFWRQAKDKIAKTEEELAETETLPTEEELADQSGWIKGKLEEPAEDVADDKETAAAETEEDKQDLFAKKKASGSALKKPSKKIPENLRVTFAKGTYRHIQLPLSLLDGKTSKPTSGDIRANQEKIKATLENFGIPVTMGEVNVGPTVTQFTLKPTDGVKLSNILSLQNDLALALAAHPIRIEAPIPGKSLVGIEVPNQSIATVRLKEIMDDQNFKNKKGKLVAALGKDVSGKMWAIDLAALPHLLIAGATGSGKSVCINSVIISLLFQNTPDDLRIIMVDPKRVELTNYNGIPHLLTPVITEASKTINALRWAVREMDERFKLFEATGKRNILAYNASVITNRLPYIVIIIDELADLMSVSPKEIEAAIVRLAQMARAVGIHLVVATQRPSVNIITGLIKANITSRIAFAVASGIDSRTILDFAGAEKLLGKGDMLYISADLSKPKRIQGALVVDEEIERVNDFWRGQAEPEFVPEVTEKQTKVNLPGSMHFDDDGDELLEEAKDVVLRAGKASASLLQRRLRVGYARAASLLDLMEEQGIIGPSNGAKPREILVSTENFSSFKDAVEPEEAEEPVDETEDKNTDEEEEQVEETEDEEANKTATADENQTDDDDDKQS